MSLAEGLQLGEIARQNKFNNSIALREQNRRELQAQTSLAQNSMVNSTGGKSDLQLQKEALLQKQLEAQNQQIQAMQSKFNADGITNILHSVIQGDWKDAYNTWNNTPGLKESIANAPSLNAVDIAPVNYNDPNDVEQLKSIGITNLNDKEVQDALNSSFMKVQGKDGKWRVTPVDSIVKETNTWNMFSTKQQEDYTKRAQYINSVLIGKNPELAARQDEVNIKMDELKTKDTELKLSDAEKWLLANPDKTYTDYKNQGKTTSSASLKDEYANLQVAKAKGELDKDNEIRLQVLDKLFSTDSDEKKKILTKGLEIVDKYKDNLFNKPISKEDVITAKLYADQSSMKVDTKTSKELKDQYNVLRNGKRLYDEVSALKDEELSRGIYDTGLQKVKQLFSDNKFNSNSPEEKAKILKSIDMNTKLGMFLAKYIKSISGAAVSDNEFARLRDLFSGSILNNTQTLKAGVTTFVEELDKQFKDISKTNLLNDPATTLDVVRMYDKDIGDTFKVSTISQPTNKSIIAVNPKTGEKLQLVNGKWEPIK